MAVQLVWLKRDLRLHDHAPFAAAARQGPVVALYVVEPSMVQADDFDAQHHRFIALALAELRQRLARRGAVLLIRTGECPAILEQVMQDVGAEALWAHEETGNALSYARDRRVRAWAKARGLPFHELPGNGVVRRLASRDGWAERWEALVRAPVANPPQQFAPLPWTDPAHSARVPEAGDMPAAASLGIRSAAPRLHDGVHDSLPGAHAAGERAARKTLRAFLTRRGEDYRRAMSSPLLAFEACSRVSAHLAWGTLSGRQAWQAAQRRRAELLEDRRANARWLASLQSFTARLAWRDHFVQKLEDEPRIEYEEFSRAYRGLRPDEADRERLDAWIKGRTGYPFVDACMRALRAHGWLNFRMRAMLVSFASYHLWLPWQATSKALAPHFLDYEPGIHYSQFQMQSGTTGINTVRIYNPYKQGLEHDPEGVFIRRWVPELEAVPTDFVHAPHEMPTMLAGMTGLRLGIDYPRPIVDHATAYRDARDRLHATRKSAAARAEAEAVYTRHGSRKEPLHKRTR
ncbi:MAG: deoxyribodipyrimidine photo-lyase [Gemmatimonadaceae bacterium]|nr:deoxyribodipyrimidine photo-lyase [Gemmatimonadaceae bacterium]